MKLRRTLTTALTALLATAGVSLAGAQPASASCAPRMFVTTGYTNGGAGPLLDRRNAPAGYEIVQIHYPQSQLDLNFGHNIQVGKDRLNFAINEYYNACGNPNALVVGYSLGALVAGDVLQTQPAYRNIQGVLFSDGRRLPAFNGDPGGILPWVPGFWIPNRSLRGFQNPTITVCRFADPICHFTGGNIGGYFNAHNEYSFNVSQELRIHGWGNYKNIVY